MALSTRDLEKHVQMNASGFTTYLHSGSNGEGEGKGKSKDEVKVRAASFARTRRATTSGSKISLHSLLWVITSTGDKDDAS